jgi:hypothetical protein
MDRTPRVSIHMNPHSAFRIDAIAHALPMLLS